MDQKGSESFPSREPGERSIARGNIWAYSGNWELFASAGVWLVRETIYWEESKQIMEGLIFHAEDFGLFCSQRGAIKKFQVK